MNPTREQYLPRLERGKRLLVATRRTDEGQKATRKRCHCGYRVRGAGHYEGPHHGGIRSGRDR